MATPMTAAQLLRSYLGEKLTVRVTKGWETHERDGETGKAFGPVNGVIIHHTASHNSFNVIWSGRATLPGPLAHAYIDKAGVVWPTSAGRANHAGLGDLDVLNAVKAESYATRPPAPNQQNWDGNDQFYGFECENLGDGKDVWPTAQYNAMVKAAASICRFHGWTEKSVIGHLEWTNQKIDPRGFTMPNFRTSVKACLAAKPGAWPPVAPPVVKLTVEQRLAKLEADVKALKAKTGLA